MDSHSECNRVSDYRTRQQAIEAKCKDCIYDPLDDGTWRHQVGRCEITDCALWVYRPRSYPKRSADFHAVQPENETNDPTLRV